MTCQGNSHRGVAALYQSNNLSLFSRLSSGLVIRCSIQVKATFCNIRVLPKDGLSGSAS